MVIGITLILHPTFSKVSLIQTLFLFAVRLSKSGTR